MAITDVTVKVVEINPDYLTLQVGAESFTVERGRLGEPAGSNETLIRNIGIWLAQNGVDLSNDALVKRTIESVVFRYWS